jgi:sarcosine oxidase subunit beta
VRTFSGGGTAQRSSGTVSTVTRPDELPRSAAVVIVGGGVMGASLAYHLARRGQRDVLLLERGDLFGQGATGKCAGGIRFQFATEINIRLSLHSIPMLERFEEELGQPIGLKQCGYLFILTREQDVAAFRRNVALRLDDVLAGTYNARDGLCDPSSVVNGYIHAARGLGATCLTNVEVTGVCLDRSRVARVQTNLGEVATDAVVNAAGPAAAQVGRMMGLDLPIAPLRRQMLVTTQIAEVPPDFPFVIDFATGLYFHREGQGILTGMANPDEAIGFDERVDLEWEQVHLDAAVRRFPLLARAGLAHHWAGLYEMTPDAHPLIGRLDPIENAYVVAGFSGHGFMQGPIAGKLLAEVMLDGSASTLDISVLSPSRFAHHAAAEREYNVV